MRALALLVGLTASASALADDEALACVKTKVWAGYSEGFAVRTMTSTAIAQDDTHVWNVTLLPGQTYRFVACAADTETLELVLYDDKGWAVARDATANEPSFVYASDVLGTYRLVAHPLKTTAAAPAETAIAVTWR